MSSHQPPATSHKRHMRDAAGVAGLVLRPPHPTTPHQATHTAPPINPFPLTRIHTRKSRAARLLEAPRSNPDYTVLHAKLYQTPPHHSTTLPLHHKPSQQSVHEISANSRPCRTVNPLWSTPYPNTVRSARTTAKRSSAASFLHPTSLTTKTKASISRSSHAIVGTEGMPFIQS
ncbi:hypothetical protein NA56DRAFT_406289 [Hyaloscypha hepaticicola]|uniref:Uncharacterized protein n=1 Tax=Hyaloscypha hepaticicola TaxID=2082293 RepID=A0A2J6PJ69_9HELO|nr:hypothetical protein NA56DRAFT_406289 [Hyaloscypha hepaticicola]